MKPTLLAGVVICAATLVWLEHRTTVLMANPHAFSPTWAGARDLGMPVCKHRPIIPATQAGDVLLDGDGWGFTCIAPVGH